MSNETNRPAQPQRYGQGGLPTTFIQMEDGTLQRVVLTGQEFFSYSEARRALEAMPEGPARAQANSRLVNAENEASRRITAGCQDAAALTLDEIREVDEVTEQQTQIARDLIERLRTGQVSAGEAARTFDSIIRSQVAYDARVDAWRSNAERLAHNYAHPLDAHDALVRRMPVLRDGRPVVSF